MSYTRAATFDVLKSLAFGSIGASYAAIGSEIFYKARVLIIINQTDADLYFSDDGTNDKLVVLSRSIGTIDIATNDASEDPWFYPAKKTWYVKRLGTPTTGNVFLATIYGRND